jgi:hypothetical protein
MLNKNYFIKKFIQKSISSKKKYENMNNNLLYQNGPKFPMGNNNFFIIFLIFSYICTKE